MEKNYDPSNLEKYQWKLREQYDQTIMKIGLEDRDKSKTVELRASYSGIWVEKLKIWVRSLEIEKL